MTQSVRTAGSARAAGVATSGAASSYLAINAGGHATSPLWSADTDYSGGSTSVTSASISTSAVASPAPQAVYQSQRYANTLTYVIPNLTPAATYTIRAHFAETYFNAAGKRVFSIWINGTQALANVDIFAAAGGANRAIIEQVTGVADATGKITVKFAASVNNASVAGLEVIGASTVPPSPTPAPAPSPVSIAGLPAIANQVMWYDAADAYTLTMNGNALAQWADRSGSGNTLYQGSAASQPVVTPNAINGLPALSFAGAQSIALTAPNAGSAAAYSVFVVAKNGAPSAYQSILGGTYESATGEFGLGSMASGAARIALTNGADVANGTSGDFSAAPEVIEGLMSSGSSAALYHTGNLDSAASTSTALRPFTSINLGAEAGSSNFTGQLAEVIVYNRVLTSAEREEVEGYLAWKWGLQTQLPAGHPYKSAPPTVPVATPPPHVAIPADAMVDSIGINTHFSYNNTAYQYLTSANPAPNGNSVLSALQTLGVRHIRDGINVADPANPALCAAMRQAHTNGADFNLIVGSTDTTAMWSANLNCLNDSSAVKSIEDLNEYVNGGNDPTDLATDVAMAKQMYNARAAGILPNVPLIAPSQTSCEAYQAEYNYQGDAVAGYFDDNNSHGYFGEYNPETAPWGGMVCGLSDAYGTMAYQIQNSSQPAPQKPIVITETGYSNGCCGNTDPNQTVDNATQAKYTLRTYLDYYAAGAKNVYLYELANDSQSFGIMDNALNPKPAYTALKSFIQALQDPGGTTIATTPLNYAAQEPSDVTQLLFQKRDGSYWLVLWQTDPSFNVSTNRPIAVPPATVMLSFGTAPTAVANSVINAATGAMTTTALTPATSLTLSVSDTPEILEIQMPNGAPATGAVRSAATIRR